VYFGASHPTPQEAAQLRKMGEATYVFGQAGLRMNRYELDGRSIREEQSLNLLSNRGGVRMRYSAAKVHVVAAATDPAPLRVRTNG
jgi:hypothetical protein